MNIVATKITTLADARAAIEATMRAGFASTADLDRLYRWEHSPARTQIFWIEMLGIPTKASVHLVRHSAVGQQHFVMSNRTDRGGEGDDRVTRATPVNHRMLLNAQHLIDVSRKRLCYQAETDTRAVWMLVRDAIEKADPDLARYMVPNCVYRGGLCVEPKSCGKMKARPYYGALDWAGMKK